MVKPFRLTYLAGGEGGVVATLPSLILAIACLTVCLLLTYRPILGLPEYKLNFVNICEMHGTGGHEVVVFDWFQRYVKIVKNWWKSAITLLFFNLMTWKAQVRLKW